MLPSKDAKQQCTSLMRTTNSKDQERMWRAKAKAFAKTQVSEANFQLSNHLVSDI